MKCNLRDGKTWKGCGKWSSWLPAENCFFRISLLLYGYKTIHFVRSGEWRKPLNRWTSTWLYYCAFSPSKMIGCGHVCWIIEQFRLFFSNSCIMFSLDQGEPNWIMMARNCENSKSEFMSTWLSRMSDLRTFHLGYRMKYCPLLLIDAAQC